MSYGNVTAACKNPRTLHGDCWNWPFTSLSGLSKTHPGFLRKPCPAVLRGDFYTHPRTLFSQCSWDLGGELDLLGHSALLAHSS